MLDEPEYLECEKRHVFYTLIGIAGFLGAFTYKIRGGVFCNAQTANLVLLAMAIGDRDLRHALYLLIPISAYILGAVISEVVPKRIKPYSRLRWDTIFIIVEMVAVIFLGILPESAPVQISQVTINFICSMQYNTFRQARGIPMATTFCTNHIRQTAVFAVKLVRHKGANEKELQRFLAHTFMLLSFIVGGIISTILVNHLKGKALFVLLIPQLIILIDLLHADLKTEKEMLDRIPKGH